MEGCLIFLMRGVLVVTCVVSLVVVVVLLLWGVGPGFRAKEEDLMGWAH